VGVESAEGEGSTFWFTLVLERQPMGKDGGETYDGLQGVRVLVADGHAATRAAISEMLSWWGCRPLEAANAAEAFELLYGASKGGDPFRVALFGMDVRIGWDNGPAGDVESDRVLNATKTITLAPLGTKEEETAQAGFDGLLVKPVRRRRLYEAIKWALENRVRITPGNPGPASGLRLEKMAHPARILLAEDNITNQMVATAMLKRFGHRVDVAANGREAIAALRNVPYDLVLMDCQMPEMDGFEAAVSIRSGAAGRRHRSIPIVAMTARAMQGDREKCLEVGMDDYLPKPVNSGDLRRVLEKWLPKREAA
jgi:CheY-like chemotaxis protein